MQTTIELPPPVEMTMPFSQVLGRRRSRREFSDQPLDLPLLSTLLWACAGQNGADGRRTGAICQSVDVGVMVQNALLACSAMGLAAVPRAWFEPQDVLGAAGLKSYDPQMAVTVGFPQ